MGNALAGFVPAGQVDRVIVKVIGTRTAPPSTPADCVRRACRLLADARQIAPPAPRASFVVRARTREDYETWKRRQTNPRYW